MPASRRGAARSAIRGHPDPCSVLELPPGTRDEAQVRAAFRRLAKVYHPDVPGTGDPDRFQAVQEAAQQLLEAGGGMGQGGASLDSIFSWAPTAPMSRSASRAPPSSAAQPLQQSDFAGSRGARIDVPACAARRPKGLKKSKKLAALTHSASPETLQRVQGVLARKLALPPAALHPVMPLEQLGFMLEQGCVGFQYVADITMALEEEFGVELMTILVGTWMKMDIPDSWTTVQGLADYVESKLAT